MKIYTPKDVLEIDEEFAEAYHDAVVEGLTIAKGSSVVVVGLARQIANILPMTFERLEAMSKIFGDFSVFVVENDSTDGTPEMIREWTPGFKVTLDTRKLDRPHLPAERDALRTAPLAEYRQACVDHVKNMDEWPDYVIAMDFDAWGGFLHEGVASSLYHLDCMDDVFGMASVSLARIPQLPGRWINYDAWAHRPLWSWRQRNEMWYHHLVPPLGCPPIRVNSAFGGLAVYRPGHYTMGRYSGVMFGLSECEHVPFHRSIYKQTGDVMALNPSSVGVMFWGEDEEQADAGE